MSATIDPFITTVHLANRWCGIQVEANRSTKFCTEPVGDKETAEKTARVVAKHLNMPYRENGVIFEKPIVSIQQKDNRWQPVKIFADRIEYVGRAYLYPKDAKIDAQVIAEEEKLDCDPEIGKFF